MKKDLIKLRPWFAIIYFAYYAVSGFISFLNAYSLLTSRSAGDAPIVPSLITIFSGMVVLPILIAVLLAIGKRNALLITSLHLNTSYLVLANIGSVALLLFNSSQAFSLIVTLIDTIATVAMLYAMILYLTSSVFDIDYIRSIKRALKIIFVICYALCVIIFITNTVNNIIAQVSFADITPYILVQILWFAGIASLWMWIFDHEREATEDRYSEYDKSLTSDDKNYISLGKHILLTLFTFGIWRLIWIYKTTDYTNLAEYEDYRSPARCLALNIFIPFYSIYWTYKTAKRIDKIAGLTKKGSTIALPCLILSLGSPIALCTVMQHKINQAILGISDSIENDTANDYASFDSDTDTDNLTASL